MREARVPRRRARRAALVLFEEAEPVFFGLDFAEPEAVEFEEADFLAPGADLAEEVEAGDWEPELDWPETGTTASSAASTATRQRAGKEYCGRGTAALMYLLYAEIDAVCRNGNRARYHFGGSGLTSV